MCIFVNMSILSLMLSCFTLGIGHAFSSFIWLCGPITGLVYATASGICNIRSFFGVVDVRICCIYNQLTILSSLCNSYHQID
ncbi:hypothetical protein Hanom_Chr07g00582761 [Helianthus anomalus]